MRRVTLGTLVIGIAALVASCGGSNGPSPSPPAIANTALRITSTNDTPIMPSRSALLGIAAASAVEPRNLFDWAESDFPQFFPGHQENRQFPPYIFRYYPETNTYLAVDGIFVRLLGPAFGPNIITVGTLPDFVCNVFPEHCVPPTANAGAAREVLVGSVVTLDGRASTDPNGAQLTFQWTGTARPAGSAALLSGANTAQPTFVADVAGPYSASLVVSNGITPSAPVTVTITAKSANVAPVANASGSRSVAAGTVISLSGSASFDQNNDPLTYQWTLARPAGSNAVLLSATTASPSFTADAAGTYVATLVVNDGTVNSQPASASISATSVSSLCCRHCTTGKPCGDSCISLSFTCHTLGGCACF